MTKENVFNAQKEVTCKAKSVSKLPILAKISIMRVKSVEDVTLDMLYSVENVRFLKLKMVNKSRTVSHTLLKVCASNALIDFTCKEIRVNRSISSVRATTNKMVNAQLATQALNSRMADASNEIDRTCKYILISVKNLESI